MGQDARIKVTQNHQVNIIIRHFALLPRLQQMLILTTYYTSSTIIVLHHTITFVFPSVFDGRSK